VESAIDRGIMVRPPRAGTRYFSGCDPSGGARDSFTLAVSHNENSAAILDCVVDQTAVQSDCGDGADGGRPEVLGLTKTVGDHYGAEWIVDAMAKVGIKYEHSDRDRSAICLDALPMFTAGRVRLLDNPRLVSQFAALERRTSPNGRDRVDQGHRSWRPTCSERAKPTRRIAHVVAHSRKSGADHNAEFHQ
jgi:hypothetical protein